MRFVSFCILWCLASVGARAHPPDETSTKKPTAASSERAVKPVEQEFRFDYREGLGPDDVAKMRSRLAMVDENLGPYFGTGPRLTVIAYRTNNIPLFGYTYIKLPVEYHHRPYSPYRETEPKILKDPEQIWIHEYGHSFFQRAMERNAANWVARNQPSPEQEKPFRNRLRKISRAYNELFADTVAVVLLNDGKAFAEFEKFIESSAEEIKSRDFTVEHSLEKLPDPTHMEGWYTALGPARTAIWKEYEKRRTEAGFSRGGFLHQIGEAMQSEILRYAADENISTDAKPLNEALIQKITETAD